MKKAAYLVLLFILFIPCGAGAEELIQKGDLLTLERCVEISLRKHPNILAARGTVNASESRVGQVEANFYP